MNKPFIHLAVRSSYSLLESMLSPKRIIEWVKTHQVPAIAISDHNNLFGALELSQNLVDIGSQPIMGCAFDVMDDIGGMHTGIMRLYAQNSVGYQRLMALSSLAYRLGQEADTHIPLSEVLAQPDGLIVLTGGNEGQLARYLGLGDKSGAEAILDRLHNTFGDRLYIEIQRHGEEKERIVEPELIALSYKKDIPIVATHDARFLEEKDHADHAALLCIAHGAYLNQADRPSVMPSQYLQTTEQMRMRFADLPEAIENTIEIAKRCAVIAETSDPILPHFTTIDDRDEGEELRIQAEEGLGIRLAAAESHYAETKDYRKRLSYELDVIIKMGFPGYFLIVSDFIKWAKAQNIPVGPGRGSGAGSLVAWSLLITDLDPLRFGLLFERFLNPERISMPDFDIDFCQEKRGEVIRYVRDRYGSESVSSIITFGTLQARAAVRDVGRVMQLPFSQVDRLAKLIPFNPANPLTLAEAIAGEEKFQEERENEPAVDALLNTALALEGLYRNASTHAAGVVIADRPLEELTPLYYDARSDLPATQYNMKWAEKAGLVKFDFLGLKTLTVIDRCIAFIKKAGGELLPSWERLDDTAAYALMSSGNTLGVFQLEGQGMRDTLRKMKPNMIEDIVALISLYRPGPMKNIDTYIDVKAGHTQPDYLHEELEDVLKETYGVIVYQEQVMQIARILSGYTLGEADVLRRAMGKKQKEEMDMQRTRFVMGAEKKNVNKVQAERIFDLVAEFAGYGFNKSHAAAYAVIAYQTAYLKAHHPVEFIAASMSLDIHNTDKLAAFYREAKRLNIPIIAPCVNCTDADFNVDMETGALKYALGAIKGVGVEAMRHIEEVRKDRHFTDLYDFAERVDPQYINRRCFESLARAGAFDAIENNRSRAFAATNILSALSASMASDRQHQQSSLFADDQSIRPPMPSTQNWSNLEQLDHEMTAIGFYLSGHPLTNILSELDSEQIIYANQIHEAVKTRPGFKMVGIVRLKTEKPARNGGKFGYVTLSDPTGEYDLMIRPESLPNMRDRLTVGQAIIATVSFHQRDGDLRLIAEQIHGLDATNINTPESLYVYLNDQIDIEVLQSVTQRLHGASVHKKGQIHLQKLCSSGLVTILLPGKYSVGLDAIRALKSTPGVEKVCTE